MSDGAMDAMWTDDTDVDPFATDDATWSAGTDGPAMYEKGPTLPGRPAPIPIDGGLSVLALAGVALAARRLRGRKALSLVALALGLAGPARAQTLAAGDVAIVEFNTNFDTGADGFRAVALVDLPANTVVKFTDRGVTTTGAFRAATGTEQEGTATFTAPAGGVAAGTVLTYRSNGTGTTAGFAPVLRAFGTTDGLTAGGDQMIVYQGDDATHTFVYAVNHNGGTVQTPATAGWNANATSALTSALPTGLVDGTTARSLTFQNSPYKGATTAGTRSALLAAIGVLANWPGSNALNTASSTTADAPTSYTVLSDPAVVPPLSLGDIAIVEFNTNFDNGLDGFKAVALVDLPAGAVIKFTDRGWTTAGTFRAATGTENEGTTTFTAPAGGVAAGTVLTYRDNGTGTTAGFVPDRRAFGTTDGLTAGGDQMIAYQGPDTAPVFVYAVNHNGGTTAAGWNTNATSALTSALPRNLDDGSTARSLTFQNSPYKGTATGTRGALLAAIGTLNVTNWPGSNALNTASSNATPAPTTYTVNAGTAATGTATVIGGEGWRLLAIPTNLAAGITIAQLAALNLVQGLPDEYPSVQPNLYLTYNGYNADNGDPDGTGPLPPNNLGFVPPTDGSTGTAMDVVIRGGRGFIWYFYDRAFGPFPNSSGTSQSRTLPMQLTPLGNDVPTTRSVPFLPADRAPAGANAGAHDGFYMLGNSFRQAFDLNGVSITAGTGTLQATFQFWNPNSGAASPFGANPGNGTPGSYVVRTTIADGTTLDDAANLVVDDAQVWQGFFAEVAGGSASTPPTFSLNEAYRRTASDPTFYGRWAGTADSVRTIAFTLSGETTSGYTTYDEAASLRFSPGGELAWDVYEASKINPFGSPTATLAPVGPGYDGPPVRLAQHSLPFTLDAEIKVPVALTVAGEGGTFVASWSLAGVPDAWTLTLHDTETGLDTDLRADASLTFTSDLTDAERFVLTIAPGQSTAAGDAPAAGPTVVGRFAPNPASGATALRVLAGPGGPLRAVLVDALGRRIQTVFDGAVSAGQAVDLRVDTSALARGVYLLRVEAGGVAETRRLTVVR